MTSHQRELYIHLIAWQTTQEARLPGNIPEKLELSLHSCCCYSGMWVHTLTCNGILYCISYWDQESTSLWQTQPCRQVCLPTGAALDVI